MTRSRDSPSHAGRRLERVRVVGCARRRGAARSPWRIELEADRQALLRSRRARPPRRRANGALAVMHDEEQARRGRSPARRRPRATSADGSRQLPSTRWARLGLTSRNVSTSSMTVSLAAAAPGRRRQQGSRRAFRRASEDDVEAAIRRLTAVQLDSISTVDRAHRLTLAARDRRVPDATVLAACSATGASSSTGRTRPRLLPIELWPHFRRVMDGGGHWGAHDRALREHADLVEPVLERIRDEGPLGSRDFEGAGRRRDVELEAGEDGARGALGPRRARDRRATSFQRALRPRRARDPEAVARRAGARARPRRCARSRCSPSSARGALTEPAIREHWRLRAGGRGCSHHLDALVAEGRLRELAVDDGGAAVLRPARSAELDGAPAPPVLVCPFDNLVWDRPLLERLFGFKHVIEVYKREHERVYGYYVLPLLAGDRFLGRADLKADRAEGVLRIRRFTPEPRVRGDSTRSSTRSRAARTHARARAGRTCRVSRGR